MTILTTDPPFESIQRLETLLESGACGHPNRSALTYFEDGRELSISYLDLWTQVRQLSCSLQCWLVENRAPPFITLFLPTGHAQVIATLATLMSGAAFVPLALDTAPARCKAIVAQSQSKAFLTDSAQAARLATLLADAGLQEMDVINMDKAKNIVGDYTVTPDLCSADDPAYVLFSSGTTGIPKGIVTPHSAVMSYCKSANKVFKATSRDKWLRAASYTFDVSIEELFVPLSVGAEVVIQPADALDSLSSYIHFLDRAGISVVSMPTALWHQLAKHVTLEEISLPEALRLIVVGGEAGMTDTLNLWRRHTGNYPQIVNAYGPTETTISCTLWEAGDFNERAVMPIGRPLSNSNYYILHPDTMNTVRPGTEGLLFISGPGLAAGYLGNYELTTRKFVPNPFSISPGYERMYNTGDLVIEDEYGILHFCGRADLQVQVRGFRVEIEAVEACLLSHPGIESAAVAWTNEQQTTSLNAYIVQLDGPLLDVDALVTHCRRSLAHYEVPARFFRVATIPLNQSGKIDRRALALLPSDEYLILDGQSEQSASSDYFDPTLARLWCDSLDGISESQLHADSHFVRLGGHSLTLITLGSKISSTFGVFVTVVELLRHLELSRMSILISEKLATTSGAADSCREPYHVVLDSYPLTLPQERLFAVQQNSPDSPFFNDGLAVDISGSLDEHKLFEAIRRILTRHAVLRGRLVQTESGLVKQKILTANEDFFGRVLTHEVVSRSRAEQRAFAIFGQSLDLFAGPLVKIVLLSSGPEEHILVVCAHHIVWDGFSDKVFLDELVKLYKGERISHAPSYFALLDAPSSPESTKLAELKSYLADVPQTVDLPNDFVRPDDRSYSRGRSVYFQLDPVAVSNVVKRQGGSPASASLTAFAVAIHLAAARQIDFMVGIPFANRVSPEAARAIGFFVNLLPVRMSFEGVDTMNELYARVKKDLVFLAEREDVPFDALVSALGMNRFSSRDSLLQVTFAFQDAPDGVLSDNTTFSRFPLNNGAARTDVTCFVEVGRNGQLSGEIEYNTDVFAHSTMESMADAIVQIIDSWARDTSQLIDNISFHAPKLSALPLPRVCNQSLGAYLSTFGERFAERDAVYEDLTGRTYTYSQLFTRAQQIQKMVRAFRTRGDSVMLLMDRSADALAAEIGVSLAGLSWIPCDVSQPRSRLYDITSDAGPACILAHKRVVESMKIDESELNVPIILLPAEWEVNSRVIKVPVDEAGEHAYVIYTSGTTGKPKGVTIGHRSIIAFLNHLSSWTVEDIPFHSVLTSNVAFDGSISQMYASIVTGGLIKMPQLGGEQDGEYLSDLMKRSPSVNYLCTTSAAVRMWLDQMGGNDSFFPANFQQILLGGDALSPALSQRIMEDVVASPKVQLKNVYGPTEGTVFSSYGALCHADITSIVKHCRVPIDQLMPHVEMTVSGPGGNSLPRGFVGEIIIWGPCLTSGYHNLPHLNVERFLTRNGLRGWRSGDLGRQLSCGRFEILGRTDSMCKVRGGFRVELAEIEAQIITFEQVSNCHVSITTAPASEEKQVVAHVVFQHDTEKDSQVVADWKQMFEGVNEEIQSFKEQVDLGFDYRGWTSSFDRRHISADDMAEWIDTTVDRILSLDCFRRGRKPRVLEIGSGTGMILFRIAPFSSKYVGLDLSAAVVSQVQAHAERSSFHHVEVHVSPAHLFEELLDRNERFDLIICNSVAQYFPSFHYFRDLVDRAASYVTENGYLFLGDLRNFSLSRQFATAVSLANRPQTVSSLENSISKCVRSEEELLVSPDYFSRFARDDERFASAATFLRHGWADTEMNLFRFDAIMRLTGKISVPADTELPEQIQWLSERSIDAIPLAVEQSTPVLVRNIPNGRISGSHLVSTLPLDGSIPLSEILHLAESQRRHTTSCRPEEVLHRVLKLHKVAGHLLCSISRPECFDLLITSRSASPREVERIAFSAQLADLDNSRQNHKLSNKSHAEVPREILRMLHDHLSRRVPSYMVPDFVVAVEAIPLTSSHKVDKSRLIAPDPSHRFIVERNNQVEWSAEDLARRSTVTAILRIFSSVLSIDKLLSPHDDFFASGGHSLIATKATSMIRRELAVALPFTAIIMCPTASELAARVETIKAESPSASQLPSHIVVLQQARVVPPRAALFVFHPLGGGLAPFASLVKEISQAIGDLAIYGVVWEPQSGLKTVHQMASTYATSVAGVQLPDATFRFLLGWSFGGMIASEVAVRLPGLSSRVLLLDAPTTYAIRGTVHESDFFRDLAEHMLEVLNIDTSKVALDEFVEILRALNIPRGDTSKLVQAIRTHLMIPSALADADLERFVCALSENFEVLVGLEESTSSSISSDIEAKVMLNLQAVSGLCMRDGITAGLGWERYTLVETDHDGIVNSPESIAKLVALLSHV